MGSTGVRGGEGPPESTRWSKVRVDMSWWASSVNGTMVWFNAAKRHGFLRTEEGERLRVDASGFAPGQLLADRCCGTRVRFERVDGEQDEAARAVGVTLLPLMAERRARMRRRR